MVSFLQPAIHVSARDTDSKLFCVILFCWSLKTYITSPGLGRIVYNVYTVSYLNPSGFRNSFVVDVNPGVILGRVKTSCVPMM